MLSADHVKMFLHSKDLGLRVQVVHCGGHVTSGCNAMGRVLDGLEFFNRGWTGIRDPNGSRVGERGVDDGFVGGDQGFFMLAAVCTCESLEDGESLLGTLNQTFGMLVEK